MYYLPEGTYSFGQNGLNSKTFLRPGHTTQAPRLLIVDRQEAQAQRNGNGVTSFSVPRYRVRFIDGHLGADGTPLAERSIVEIVIRQPTNASVDAVTTSLEYAAEMLADPEFVNDAIVDLMFPREHVEE